MIDPLYGNGDKVQGNILNTCAIESEYSKPYSSWNYVPYFFLLLNRSLMQVMERAASKRLTTMKKVIVGTASAFRNSLRLYIASMNNLKMLG